MTRRYRVSHRTRYEYGAPMTDGYSVACLVPRPTKWQTVIESDVHLDPTPSEWDSYIDAFGNLVNQFGLHEPHDAMSVESVSIVEVAERPMPDDDTPWEAVIECIEALRDDLAIEVGFYRASSKYVDVGALSIDLAPIVAEAFVPGRPIIEAASALCQQIYGGFRFDPGFSTVATPLRDVLAARRGVCQDFAHLAVACLRSVGLAARYVSGYIETIPPAGKARLVGADASHAWCSVWTPKDGWVDFDPTNGHLPVNDHVTVGWGRDYADVTPVRGVMIGPATTQTLAVAVDMERLRTAE